MTTTTSHPPSTHHRTSPIPHSTAHSTLSTFLTLAALDSSYRPDAVLTERGPTGGTDLVLHQLERIASGMRGEVLGVEFEEMEGERRNGGWKGDGGEDMGVDGRRDKGKKREGQGWRETEAEVIGTGGKEEQETREEYDLEQGEEDEVDVGNMDRGAGGGEEVEEVIGVEGEEVAETVEVPVRKHGKEKIGKIKDLTTGSSKLEGEAVSKEERKRLKKERRKLEKKTATKE